MKKILIVPDSFKGTMRSQRICEILEERIHARFPGCETVSIPIADGGEGTVSCFTAALGGSVIKKRVKNAFFEEIDAAYGLVDGGKTAIIEMASCAGLPMAEGRKDPGGTTTYGVGQLMLSAIEGGCKRIIVGLGGSCTNDAGAGAAAAAGAHFYRQSGEAFLPVGSTLGEVAAVDISDLAQALRGVEIVAMCDIDNPPYGEMGAAYQFAPQKGADERMVSELDAGVKQICDVIQRDLGLDIGSLPGGGAAGAMGAGMAAFFGGRLQKGIEAILDMVGFEELARGADLILTGEGKVDGQTLHGKVVAGVGRRAKELGVPVVVLAGGAEPDIDPIYEQGVSAVFPINRMPEDFSVSRYKSEENLRLTADNILRLIACIKEA